MSVALSRLEAHPRLALGHFPSPLVRMKQLERALGAGRELWVKHDDYAGPGFGGNKVRKLEYELAAAVAAGATDVLTVGGIRSNHCRITAALAARLGLRCCLVLNGAAPGEGVGEPASHAMDRWYGAETRYVDRGSERAAAMVRWADELPSEGRRPYMIPLGASTPLGACGFARAVLELRAQCEALGWRPGAIVHATSSGGTQAGMVAGLWLAGWRDVELAGVSADESAETIGGMVRRLVHGVEGLLGLPEGVMTAAAPVFVEDGFIGEGYGVPSEAGRAAARLLARTEGIVLDPVYTAKAMAAVLAKLERWGAGPLVFWHTGGQLANFQLGPE